ncbi:hypothetical protein ACS0TY_017954 [Phlomoides rotata]
MEMVGDCIPIKSNDRSCNLSGIPCNHAISAITNQNLDPEDFLDDCYNIETYKRVYAPSILPIAGQTECAPTLFIPPMPPNFGKKLGRPSSSRFAGIGETKNVKKGKVLKLKNRHIESKCTKCRTFGNNSRSCPQSENARRQKRKVTRKQGNGADAQAECEDVEAQGEDTQAQDEDDTEFEALLSQAMLNQDSCDVPSLGMKAVHCKVGPTPFQQLYEDYISPYVPKMFSGPNIRATPPFVHGGSI